MFYNILLYTYVVYACMNENSVGSEYFAGRRRRRNIFSYVRIIFRNNYNANECKLLENDFANITIS